MEGNKSELEKLILDIQENRKQISINKADEIKVMQCMLNDKNFSLGIYEKNAGYVGQRCPHDEFTGFLKNVISGATGLDSRDSKHLAEKYEATKRDANYLLENMRDFVQVYTETGRKFNILQTATSEANIYTKEVPSINKTVPDKNNPGQSKYIKTTPYTKLVSSSTCPKYLENNENK